MKKTELQRTAKFLCQCRPLVMSCSFGESSYVDDGTATSTSREKDAVRMGDSVFLVFSLCMLVWRPSARFSLRGRIAAIGGIEAL